MPRKRGDAAFVSSKDWLMRAGNIIQIARISLPSSTVFSSGIIINSINTLGYSCQSIEQTMDDGDNPYESLPGGNTVVYMGAGALAGLLEHCVMYPVDVVRTRMQSIRPQKAHQGFWITVAQLIRTERFKTFRGMSAVMVGAGPAHAFYFSCYENLKRFILDKPTYLSNRAFVHGIAGCGATLVHDAIMNPAEVIKQRMQMYKSPFRTSFTCFRHILQKEGLKAFYRSYFTQLTMNLPYQAIHFVAYEYMQDLTNENRYYNPKAHVISGAFAGAAASACTTPLDVCKTLLNTQEKLALVAVKKDRITGLTNAAKVVYKCCGFRGYFQGLQARVIVAMPSTAISWSVYEFFKYRYKQN